MHRSLLKPFVYLASVCWSLQCLNFHPDRQAEVVSCSGSLVQSYCEEGGALQTNITGLCGEQSHCSRRTGFAPAHGCVLSPSTLLRLPAALYGVGPALRAVPVFGYSTKARTLLGLRSRSSSGSQELDGRTHLQCNAYYPSAVPASVSTRWSGAPCVCSRELASRCGPPGGCRPSRISGSLWLETGRYLQFGRGCLLWC